MSITFRIARWHKYMTNRGVTLKQIAVHPSDYGSAPSHYAGIPIVCLGNINNG
jgi:hypothetical protein